MVRPSRGGFGAPLHETPARTPPISNRGHSLAASRDAGSRNRTCGFDLPLPRARGTWMVETPPRQRCESTACRSSLCRGVDTPRLPRTTLGVLHSPAAHEAAAVVVAAVAAVASGAAPYRLAGCSPFHIAGRTPAVLSRCLPETLETWPPPVPEQPHSHC